MNRQLNLSLILPCFNEAPLIDNNTREIIKTLSESRLRFEIIFVDDGSIDSTRKHILQLCRLYTHCRYVFHKKNIGRGAAVATGIYSAKAPIVGYIDIDCEVSPLYIPTIVRLIQENHADIVVGKRMYRTSLFSIIREVLSIGYQAIAGILFDTRGIDTESGYKFFDRKAFLPVLKTINNQGWFWDTESIVLSLRRGLRIQQEPVLFMRKKEKKSTVRIIPDTFFYISQSYQFYRRLHRNKKRV